GWQSGLDQHVLRELWATADGGTDGLPELRRTGVNRWHTRALGKHDRDLSRTGFHAPSSTTQLIARHDGASGWLRDGALHPHKCSRVAANLSHGGELTTRPARPHHWQRRLASACCLAGERSRFRSWRLRCAY